MSDQGRLWSKNLRGGLTICEHAVAREFGDCHHKLTGLVNPAVPTTARMFEVSDRTIQRIVWRLLRWRLITEKKKDSDPITQRHKPNILTLNFERHFPYPINAQKLLTGDAGVDPWTVRDDAMLAGALRGEAALKVARELVGESFARRLKECHVQEMGNWYNGATKQGSGRFVAWFPLHSAEDEKEFRKLMAPITDSLSSALKIPAWDPKLRKGLRVFYLRIFHRLR